MIENLCIITAYNSAFAEIGDICADSIARYCKPRSINFAINHIPDDFARPPSWAKIGFIRAALHDADAVLWVDADAMIVGERDIRSELFPATLNISRDANGINCGVMAWKKCHESHRALDRLEESYEQFKDHPWYEQISLMQFVDELAVYYQPKAMFNAYADDFCASTFIRHWPATPNEQRLAEMREVQTHLK